MDDQDKSREQLIQEIEELRQKVSELQAGRIPGDISSTGSIQTEGELPSFEPTEESSDPRMLSENPDISTETIDLNTLFAQKPETFGGFDRAGLQDTPLGKLMQALPVPALLINPKGIIIFANQFCGRISPEYKRVEGRPFSSIFPDPHAAKRCQELFEKAVSTRKHQSEVAVLEIDTNRMWGRMNFRSLRIGQERAILALVEDLTFEKKQLLLNKKLQEELERRVQKRTEQLSVINEQLKQQIADRQRAEQELQKAHEGLERRVQERTAELLKTNEQLTQEIAERKRAEADLAAELKKFEALYDLAVAITAQQSLDHNLALVVETSRELLGAETAWLSLKDEASGELCSHTFSGIRTDTLKRLRIPDGVGLGGRITCTGVGYICKSYSEEFRTEIAEAIVDENLVSGVAVPVQVGQKKLGVLYVFNRHPTQFSRADLDTLALFGNLAAVEITQKQAEQQLRLSEERYKALYEESRTKEKLYRSLLNSSADAIVIYDMNGNTQFVSPSFSRIFGWTMRELHGREIPFIPDSETESTIQMLGGLLREGLSVSSFETRRYTKDGRILDISISASRHNDHLGNPTGILTILHDITDRNRAAQELEEALALATKLRAEAEAANRSKTEFLANMSHELRTPLNAVIGFADLLADQTFGEINERQMEYLGYILRSGRHLLQLINHILDLAKVELGKSEIQLSRVNIRELLENSLFMVKEKAIKHRLSLDLRVNHELEEIRIHADEVKLKQIVFNLLSNAAKFTPDGGSVVLESHRDQDELIISITDTGIGVRPEDRERIFHMFEQADSSYSRRQQGTGLGLALSKSLVELHGGRIWLEPAPGGKGTTFSIAIPYLPVLAQADSAEGSSAGEGSNPASQPIEQSLLAPENKRVVLVVEDNLLNMKLASTLLETAGYQVLQANSAEEGLDIARKQQPDLILMDIRLPGMDGLAATQILQQDPVTRGIPVAAFTAHALKGVVDKALAAGCVGYIAKPIDARSFAKEIAGLLQNH